MDELIDQIWGKKYTFLGTFFAVFTVTYLILLTLDWLPEPRSEELVEIEVAEPIKIGYATNTPDMVATTSATDLSVEEVWAPLPVSIIIQKLDKTLTVLNPVSRTVADLDTALLDGIVRHPDSATLTQEGNVFILGHSSYLPTVFNKNFQAFNGIQDLEWGDMIEVYSDDTKYTYRVEKVYRAKAQDVTVPIAGVGNMLTLATCNSFGTTDDRFVVEAKRIAEERL